MAARSILIIDEDRNLRAKVVTNLRAAGSVVYTADSLEMADRVLLSKQIGLVICPVRVRGRSGLDYLRRLRSEHPPILRALWADEIDLRTAIKAINAAQIHFLFPRSTGTAYLLAAVERVEEWVANQPQSQSVTVFAAPAGTVEADPRPTAIAAARQVISPQTGWTTKRLRPLAGLERFDVLP